MFVVAKTSFIAQLRRKLNNDGKFQEVIKWARPNYQNYRLSDILKRILVGTLLSKDHGLWSVRRLKLQKTMAAVR